MRRAVMGRSASAAAGVHKLRAVMRSLDRIPCATLERHERLQPGLSSFTPRPSPRAAFTLRNKSTHCNPSLGPCLSLRCFPCPFPFLHTDHILTRSPQCLSRGPPLPRFLPILLSNSSQPAWPAPSWSCCRPPPWAAWADWRRPCCAHDTCRASTRTRTWVAPSHRACRHLFSWTHLSYPVRHVCPASPLHHLCRRSFPRAPALLTTITHSCTRRQPPLLAHQSLPGSMPRLCPSFQARGRSLDMLLALVGFEPATLLHALPLQTADQQVGGMGGSRGPGRGRGRGSWQGAGAWGVQRLVRGGGWRVWYNTPISRDSRSPSCAHVRRASSPIPSVGA